MKKFTLILAAIIAANFASAQIQKVGVVQGRLMMHTTDYFCGNVLYSVLNQDTKTTITVYNLSGAFIQEYKSISINKVSSGNQVQVEHLSTNYFTTDGKICFLYHEYSGSYPNFVVHKCQVMDEDGNVVYDVTDKPFYEGSIVLHVNGTFYLLLEDILTTPHNSHIFALPGNGDGGSTDISSTPAPERRSGAKFISKDGQVMVQNGDDVYTMRGELVK